MEAFSYIYKTVNTIWKIVCINSKYNRNESRFFEDEEQKEIKSGEGGLGIIQYKSKL